MPKYFASLCFTMAALALSCSVSLADGATSTSTAPQRVAQANPNNDPNVQRGINERNEQERQSQIQACVSRAEANMNPTAAAQQDSDIRNGCSRQFPPYAGIRG
jgi:hypothetical protein